MNNKLSFFSKGISTPVGIIIIVVCALLAGGAIAWQEGWLPKIKTIIPTPSPAPKDETAGWKTFQSEIFEIKYPDTLSIKRNDNGIELYFPLPPNFIAVYQPSNFFNGMIIKSVSKIDGVLLDIKSIQNVEDLEKTIKDVTKLINLNIEKVAIGKNLEGLKITGYELTEEYGSFSNKYCPSTYFVTDGNIVISFLTIDECGKDSKSESVQRIFSQILSTFKYVGRDQTSVEGKFCGGIGANLPENQCPSGYKCQLDGSYPDAGGKCIKR